MLAALAMAKGEGWSDPYVFVNPQTKSMQTKVNDVTRVGDTFIGVGVYK